ncbi:TPA: hypothetical protein QC285_004706 [Bacillus cereus]|uniref:DUF1453 domain-containing protein n=4 Tax=Bacillus cereus group TaxID=86661 RepID=A0A9X6YFS9_BACTU|nr:MULTISPECIES: DUF6622 family protein [Bacillus cereus group]EKS8376096.1 hypothetical protein [Bacillus cereus]EKS8383712.1 hypothetical protein [Bacillus cereus]EMA7399203.1 hypothetical protein [Bacillus cereus]KGT40819.1 hypothetical protein IY08_28545 [Bacillus cereus]MDA2462565.1 hypothetical protein [Bacillus cereus]
MIKEVLIRTPLWVWILLFILIKRGIAISQERPINLSKMFLVPVIFMMWGLEKIINKFSHLGYCLISYTIFILPGILIGYLLYKKYQIYFKQDTVIFRKKCYLPLIIILINFFVKYLLNVTLEVSSSFYDDIAFNVMYSAISGLSVGLFFGGILYTFYMQSKLKNITLQS